MPRTCTPVSHVRRTNAITNSGTHRIMIVLTDTSASRNVSFQTAAAMPASTPISTSMRIASVVSRSVFGAAAPSRSATGLRDM